MTNENMLKEQTKRPERVKTKEAELIKLLGYEELFKTISCIMNDYDKELIYDKVFDDLGRGERI